MKTVKPNLDLPEIDKSISAFWEENKTFEASLELRKDAPQYLFYDGPPFSSGHPHYGHLLVGTLKDIIPRYQTMKGFYVERRFGWDTHGLPIEMIIEKELGLNGRPDIVEHGIDKFNEACRAGVLSCVDVWRTVVNRLGRWVDMDNDYKTMDLDFMESVWWAFKQLWDKGRIYEGVQVMPYSWRLSTPLSNFEAGLNYKDVQDPAVTVRFKLKEIEDTSALAWTTTPWTLPSNMALCVGPDIDYVQIQVGDEKVLFAEARLPAYFKDESEYEILNRYKGSELEGHSYTPPFDYFSDETCEGAFKIVMDDYVTTEDGTGLVHQSPAHGEDDFRIGGKYGLPVHDPVDADGNFTEPVSDVAGQNIKEADKTLIKLLKERGVLFRQDTLNHSYPFCERSETPLIYKTISAWFVKVEDIRDEMLENNQEIHWVPEHIKDGRFGKWLAAARDWNISRNRFWGNPIPVWKCTECEHSECIGSHQELEEKSGETVADIHKHFVDDLHWNCSECGGQMNRTPEVLDCWFESGSMPYAQFHYPFENKEQFEQSFPADFISESLDQTRSWFYTLMVMSTSIFKSAPFKNCIVTGMILAEDGKKMSKRLKNYPDPLDVLDTYGADALRLYIINSPLLKANSLNFSEKGVKEIVRSVLIPYWNVYSFLTTYANVDGFKPSALLVGSDNVLDRWILSRFQTLLKSIEEEMGRYQLFAVVPAILEFLEELSNWYVRRSRRRFWTDDEKDKQNGYNTLYYVVMEFSRSLAPFLPFITEEIYRNLATLQPELPDSVHLTDYPTANEELRDSKLEEEMALIQKTVGLGRSLRARLNLRVRQPLQSITVVTCNESDAATLQTHGEHIKDELNVKEVLFSSHEEDLVEIILKPNFPVLGPKFGPRMGELTKELKQAPADKVRELEAGGTIEALGETLTLEECQVVRQAKDDKNDIETAAGVTVFFDTELSDSLLSEGLAREFVNRVQKLRKDADFHISDRIKIEYSGAESIQKAVSDFDSYIREETLALEMDVAATEPTEGDIVESVDIEGDTTVISLVRLST